MFGCAWLVLGGVGVRVCAWLVLGGVGVGGDDGGGGVRAGVRV